MRKEHPRHVTYFLILENWYFALKHLAATWEEDEAFALEWLFACNLLDSYVIDSYFPPNELVENISELRKLTIKSRKTSKFGRLEEQLRKEDCQYGDKVKCIIFVHTRVTAVLVFMFIDNIKYDFRGKGMQPTLVTGCGAITPSTKVTKSQARANLNAFRSGMCNVLVATATAAVVKAFWSYPLAIPTILLCLH